MEKVKNGDLSYLNLLRVYKIWGENDPLAAIAAIQERPPHKGQAKNCLVSLKDGFHRIQKGDCLGKDKS